MSSAPFPPPQGTPQPSGPTKESRNWAMAAHLSALVTAWVALALVGPLVVWLVKKDDDPFVAEHSREALNFQLTWLAAGIVGGIIGFVLTVVTFGLGFLVVGAIGLLFGLAWLVLMVVGAVKASNGEHFRYPLTIRLVS